MKWTYQTEYVACGKKCSGCPHGPYWYRYRREADKLIKEYVGKFRPLEDLPDNAYDLPDSDPRKQILDRRTATPSLAYSILGLHPTATEDQAKRMFETLASFCRMDLDHLADELALISCAYSYLRVYNGWK